MFSSARSASGGNLASTIAGLALALTVLLAPVVEAKKTAFDMPACDRLTNNNGSDQSAAGDATTSTTTATTTATTPATPATETVADTATGTAETAPTKGAPATQSESDPQPSEAAATAAPVDVEATAQAAETATDADKTADKTADIDKTAETGNKPSKAKGMSLEPVKLTDEQPACTVGKDGKVKIKVSKNVRKKKEEDTPDKMLKDAKRVNITPLALLESQEEAQQKMDMIGEAEKLQLTDLWAATINRSPDIQFVIQRMQPHSDPNHATSSVIRILGGCLFSAAQAVPMMMGGPGVNTMMMYGASGSGASMLNQLIGRADAKNQKKAQISQEQATMLYKMVRETADKLVANFREYKKCRNAYERANTDLEDIKAMVAQSREGQDPAKIIEMEYTVRKAQRDLDAITDEARVHRQSLSDLAGGDAIAKLDDQVDEEQTAVKNMTGGSAPKEDDSDKNDKLASDKKDKSAEGAPKTADKPDAANKSQDKHDNHDKVLISPVSIPQ